SWWHNLPGCYKGIDSTLKICSYVVVFKKLFAYLYHIRKVAQLYDIFPFLKLSQFWECHCSFSFP
ncbi:hypothetical protein X975_02789, partial [Stegodyphus mimosarum]